MGQWAIKIPAGHLYHHHQHGITLAEIEVAGAINSLRSK